MSQAFYQEKQVIPSVWRIVIFGGVVLLMGFIFLMTYMTEWDTMPREEKWSLLTLLIAPLSVLFIFMIRLDLRITDTYIEFRMGPFSRKYRKIRFTDIAAISLTASKGLKSLQKVGVHRQINRTEYNLGGKHILEIKLKKGRLIAFSTFKPKELEYFLRNLPEEVPVVWENR